VKSRNVTCLVIAYIRKPNASGASVADVDVVRAQADRPVHAHQHALPQRAGRDRQVGPDRATGHPEPALQPTGADGGELDPLGADHRPQRPLGVGRGAVGLHDDHHVLPPAAARVHRG